MKEVDYQRLMNQQVVKDGGYAKKWATPYSVGVPDLIWVVSGDVWFVEVKLEVAEGSFLRTIRLTDKQKLELDRLRKAGALVAVVVVVVKNNKARCIIKEPPSPAESVMVSSDDLLDAYSLGEMSKMITDFKRSKAK